VNGPALVEALWLSLQIATCATAAVMVVAVPMAFVMARKTFALKSVVETVVLLPLVLPPTVVGYLILVALGKWVVFRFEGAVLAASVVALPLLYLPSLAAFAAVDREFEDIARLFGATGGQVFWKVSLPLARRGILSGLVLAFARALGEFGATVLVFGSGPNRTTLPISIYLDASDNQMQRAAGAVITLSALAMGLVAIHNYLSRRHD